jgi:hypothetical protein
MRKEIALPTVVYTMEVRMIVLVEGKATLLMKL